MRNGNQLISINELSLKIRGFFALRKFQIFLFHFFRELNFIKIAIGDKDKKSSHTAIIVIK